MRQKILIVWLLLFSLERMKGQPEAFAMLDSLPQVKIAYVYHGSENFIGRPVNGYTARKILATRPTYFALLEVQKQLLKEGLGLKIFDAYRPQRAVDHFVRWAHDLDDTLRKSVHYPDVPKDSLFEQGFIASRSGHSRGSTVDLTLYRLDTGAELDMGTAFDYFGSESWPYSHTTTVKQHQNRMKLRKVMMQHGFEPLATEWWHFTLKNEPFPETYFNFPISK